MTIDQDHSQWAVDKKNKAITWRASIKYKKNASKHKLSDGEEPCIPSAPKKGKGSSLFIAKSFKAALVMKVQMYGTKINDVVNVALCNAKKMTNNQKSRSKAD